jgi:putative tricarboxylic transport membrane protein
MLKKKVITFGVMAIAASLMVAPSIQSAEAALKPDFKANAGDQCLRPGKKAVGRGVNKTDLICTRVTTGSYAGTLRWWYPDMKPLNTIDWTIPGNPGGYSLTADVVSTSLKTEGLMTNAHSMVYKAGAGGTVGLGAFQEIKGKPDAALITGIAMVGGAALAKSKLDLMDSFPVAKIMREYNAVVVPTSSKYRTLNDLLNDISANGKNVAIVGGNAGGVDHQIMGLLLKAKEIPVSKLNYVVLSGGTSVAAQLLAGGVAAGISGSTEFKPFVDSGKLRVLGVSSQKRLKTFKGKTFIEQGVNLYYGNWRGIMVPADLTAAEKLNWLRVMDALRGTPTWKAVLAANSWDDEFAAGDAYTAFLKKEIPIVNAVIKDLGL